MTLLLTKKLCAYCTPINGVTQEKAQFDKKKSPVQPMQPAGGGGKSVYCAICLLTPSSLTTVRGAFSPVRQSCSPEESPSTSRMAARSAT